jgi:putative NADPH-quinone reductase
MEAMKKKSEKNKERALKVLAIVASARKKGVVASLAAGVLKGAEEVGAETETINLYDYDLRYCRGCWACERKKRCVLDDDFGEIFEKVLEADILILAAPVYWSNVPGIMKTFFDRQCGLAVNHGEGKMLFGMRVPLGFKPEESVAGKKIVLVAACTAPWPFNILLDESRGALRAMKNYTRKIKGTIAGKIVYTDSRFQNVKGKRKRYEKKAYTLGLRVARSGM